MLLFDAGNSRCKWVWLQQGKWLRQGALANMDDAAWHELKKNFAEFGLPHRILVSNVAGQEVESRLRDACAQWSVPLEFVRAQAEQCGVHNSYMQPAQLGSDRWAALLAAWKREGRACLVVNCGTATTVDALSGQGEFMGGLILPGMELMQRSLLRNTAQLDNAMGEPCRFPRNTADAIVSGAIRATAGAVRYQYNLLAKQGTVPCLVSGGAAGALLPHLDVPAEHVENLVLHGLQCIAQDCLSTKETML